MADTNDESPQLIVMTSKSQLHTQTHSTMNLIIVGSICVTLAGGVLLYLFDPSFFSVPAFGPAFGTASVVILLGMFGLYRYAFSFYKDPFYQLISIGWLLNAGYISFEAFFKPTHDQLVFSIWVYALGIFTAVPFFVASFAPVDGEMPYQKLLIWGILWLSWLTLSSFVVYLGIFPNMDGYGDSTKFIVFTAGGIPFAMWVLVKVARSARERVDPAIHRGWAVIFPLTFFVYAMLQPVYLLKLRLGDSYLLRTIFVAALLPKIVNSVAALKLIQLNTAKVQQLLQRKSVLSDLGALTTSIEHDISNPLEVISFEFSSMRNRFQGNQAVMDAVRRLEEQTSRIQVATDIIPIIRGEQDYYDAFMDKVNIQDLVHRSIRAVKKERKPVDVYFRVEKKDLFVRAYSQMLEQAIVNVFRNSLEAIRDNRNESGIINVHFRSEVINEKKMVVVDFEDNGGGIPEDILPKVDELFMSTRSTKKSNSGIGLFITKRILAIHQGNFVPSNNRFPGATITFFLPQWVESKDV